MKTVLIVIGLFAMILLLRTSFRTVDREVVHESMSNAYELGKLNYEVAMRKHLIDVAMGTSPGFNVNVVKWIVDSMERAEPRIYGELTKPK